MLNLVKKKLKEEEKGNSSPNNHYNFYHTGPEVPPNPNGSKEKCYVCLKWFNKDEIMYREGGKFDKVPLCSLKCVEELDKNGKGGQNHNNYQHQGFHDNKDNYFGDKDSSYSNYGTPPNWDRITQLKNDIEHLKKYLSEPSITEKQKSSTQEKLSRLEKELEEERLKDNHIDENQNSGTSDKTTIKDNIQAEQTKKNNEYSENLNQAEKPSATLEEKAEVIKKSGLMAGEETPEQQSRREKLEAELAEQDQELANQALLGRIENNLKANNLTLGELPSEIQADLSKIKNNKDTTIIININIINININKIGAQKRIEKLEKEIKNLANDNLRKIKELKEKLLKIIYGNNKYDQEHKQKAQSLLDQLESKQLQNPSDSKFPIG